MKHLRHRIVVTGMAGAGKSTFSKQLAQKTGIPLVHIDLLSWDPGWVRRSDDIVKQHLEPYLANPSWILDGNDQLEVSLKHADTLIIMDTPWWLCAWRAFLRGLRRSKGSALPDGCKESHWQRLIDEWAIVARHFRRRHHWRQEQRALAVRYQDRLAVHLLTDRQSSKAMLDHLLV